MRHQAAHEHDAPLACRSAGAEAVQIHAAVDDGRAIGQLGVEARRVAADREEAVHEAAYAEPAREQRTGAAEVGSEHPPAECPPEQDRQPGGQALDLVSVDDRGVGELERKQLGVRVVVVAVRERAPLQDVDVERAEAQVLPLGPERDEPRRHLLGDRAGELEGVARAAAPEPSVAEELRRHVDHLGDHRRGRLAHAVVATVISSVAPRPANRTVTGAAAVRAESMRAVEHPAGYHRASVHVGYSLLTLFPGRVGGSETNARGLLEEFRAGNGPERVTVLANRHVAHAYSRYAGGPVSLHHVRSYRAGDSLATRALAMGFARAAPRLVARDVPRELDLVHFPVTVPIPRTSRPEVVTLFDVQHLDMPEFFSRSERRYRRWA